MAHVYGKPQAEMNAIKNVNIEVENLGDIEKKLSENEINLKNRKSEFFKKLPKDIEGHKKDLESEKVNLKDTKKVWDEKINLRRNSIKNEKKEISNKRLHHIFVLPFFYTDLALKKYVQMPHSLSSINKCIKNIEYIIDRLENEPEVVFEEQEDDLIGEIKHIEEHMSSVEYSGAVGEVEVLEELKKLDSRYYIFCDLNVYVPRYITYKGKKNLHSAQIDFVVVGKNGVFVIEVKNWSSSFASQTRDFSPHEQVDRAGLLMYVLMKDTMKEKPLITKILVSPQGNIQYNSNYKYVFVKNLRNLIYFIQNQNRYLSDRDYNKILSKFEKDYR